jgi:hypothetical protein
MSDMNEPIDWNKFSPATMFRDWVAKSEAQWSQTASELMKDPRAGEMLNRQVNEARMMQRMFAEFAQGTLAVANLPSRSDVEGLDERMGRVEDGLAALSAEVVRLREALGPRVAAPAPSRTRRPPPPAPKEAGAKTVTATKPTAAKRGTNKGASVSPTKRQKGRPDPGKASDPGKS